MKTRPWLSFALLAAAAVAASATPIPWNSSMPKSDWVFIRCTDTPANCASCPSGYAYRPYMGQVAVHTLWLIQDADAANQFTAADHGRYRTQSATSLQLRCGTAAAPVWRTAARQNMTLSSPAPNIVVTQVLTRSGGGTGPAPRRRRSTTPAPSQRRAAPAPTTTGAPDPLEYALFEQPGSGTGATAASAVMESDWLTHPQRDAALAACQGTAAHSPACKAAVLATRGHVEANVRADDKPRYTQLKAHVPSAVALRPARDTDFLNYFRDLGSRKWGYDAAHIGEVSITATDRVLCATDDDTVKTARATALSNLELQLGTPDRPGLLPADDHVARHKALMDYRTNPSLPCRGTPPTAVTGTLPPPQALLDPLSPAQTALLKGAALTAYRAQFPQDPAAPFTAPPHTAAEIALYHDAAHQAAIRAATDWLRTHPTLAAFDALTDPAAKLAVCEQYRSEQPITGGATTGTTDRVAIHEATHAVGENGNRQSGTFEGETNRGDTDAVTATNNRRTPNATSNSNPAGGAYQWPREFAERCRTIVRSNNPATSAGLTAGIAPVPNPTSTQGRPTQTHTTTPAKSSYNALLNGAKGGIAGAIVGFALGGPAGMLIGALLFGGAAWGLTKVGDA
jgi:hypothetical protein